MMPLPDHQIRGIAGEDLDGHPDLLAGATKKPL
jgi:hypothetical protein